ncbi:hypothetical protein H9P43_000691 [Blastocladiella emersonii ATCC 22665]|nr:hypothetical protein H9P43_000691 [Blastocladiella emersonii ATCC 22665]
MDPAWLFAQRFLVGAPFTALGVLAAHQLVQHLLQRNPLYSHLRPVALAVLMVMALSRGVQFAASPYGYLNSSPPPGSRLVFMSFFSLLFSLFSLFLLFWFRLSYLAHHVAYSALGLRMDDGPDEIHRIYRGVHVAVAALNALMYLLHVLWFVVGSSVHTTLRSLAVIYVLCYVGVTGGLLAGFYILARLYEARLPRQARRIGAAAATAMDPTASPPWVVPGPNGAQRYPAPPPTLKPRDDSGQAMLEFLLKPEILAKQRRATRIALVAGTLMLVNICLRISVAFPSLANIRDPDNWLGFQLVLRTGELVSLGVIYWFLAVIPCYSDRLMPVRPSTGSSSNGPGSSSVAANDGSRFHSPPLPLLSSASRTRSGTAPSKQVKFMDPSSSPLSPTKQQQRPPLYPDAAVVNTFERSFHLVHGYSIGSAGTHSDSPFELAVIADTGRDQAQRDLDDLAAAIEEVGLWRGRRPGAVGPVTGPEAAAVPVDAYRANRSSAMWTEAEERRWELHWRQQQQRRRTTSELDGSGLGSNVGGTGSDVGGVAPGGNGGKILHPSLYHVREGYAAADGAGASRAGLVAARAGMPAGSDERDLADKPWLADEIGPVGW